MKKISYKGYRFPLEVIQKAIRIYVRFTLSIRYVEDLLAERGIMAPYETVRHWVNREASLPSSDAIEDPQSCPVGPQHRTGVLAQYGTGPVDGALDTVGWKRTDGNPRPLYQMQHLLKERNNDDTDFGS